MRSVFFGLIAVAAVATGPSVAQPVDVKETNSTAVDGDSVDAAIELDGDAKELQEALSLPYADIRSKMDKLLSDYIDADGDGAISSEELTQWLEYLYEAVLSKHVKEKMAVIDKDNDGSASLDEVIADTTENGADITEAEKEEVGLRFKACDGDKDGKLNFSELLSAIAPRHFYEAAAVEAKAVTMSCDKNEDEKLTLEEFSAAPESFMAEMVGSAGEEDVAAFFEVADADADGLLSEEELTNHIIKVAEQHSDYAEIVESVVSDLLPTKPLSEEKLKAKEEAAEKKTAKAEKEEKAKEEKAKEEKETEPSSDDDDEYDERTMSIKDILDNSTTLASWVMSEVTESGDVLKDFDSFELEPVGGEDDFGGENPFGGGEMNEEMLQQLLKMLGGGGEGGEGGNPFGKFGGDSDEDDDDFDDDDDDDYDSAEDETTEDMTEDTESENTKDEL